MNIFNNSIKSPEERRSFAKLLNDGMNSEGMQKFKIIVKGEENKTLVISNNDFLFEEDIVKFVSTLDPKMPDLFFNYWKFTGIVVHNEISGLHKYYNYELFVQELV